MSAPAPLKYAVVCHVAYEGSSSQGFATYEEALAEYESMLERGVPHYYVLVELVAVFKEWQR